MLDRSLIISYSTPNYDKLTQRFKQCLYTLGVKDENICHKLDLFDRSPYIKSGFRTDLWYVCLLHKLKHLIDTLKNYNTSKYHYFISSDCDIQYLPINKQEWISLENYMIEHNKDIYFMRENKTPEVNGGFYIIRNINLTKTITFFELVYSIMKNTDIKEMPHGDQTIINSLKFNLNFGRIPNEYIIYAGTIYNRNSSIIHHAVEAHDVNDKINQMDYILKILENK